MLASYFAMDLQIAQILRSSLAPDAAERAWALEALHGAAAQPEFCACLLRATAAQPGLGDDERLLAATQLKNEVVRRWRKGGCGIAEAERPALRTALLARLAQPETSERVGAQLAVAVARVMRCEANGGEATVLEVFEEALRYPGQLPGHALLALSLTVKELASMRLPVQRRLAARVGRAMLRSVPARWRAAVALAVGAGLGASAASVRAASLHTKLLRRLLELTALSDEPPPPPPATLAAASAAESPASCGPWDAAAASVAAVEAAGAAQRLAATPLARYHPLLECGAASARDEWARLAGAAGKLVAALYRQLPKPSAASQLALGAAAAFLVAEAGERLVLREAVGVAGAAGAAAALDALDARETYCSALPARLATLLERAEPGDDWAAAVAAAVAPTAAGSGGGGDLAGCPANAAVDAAAGVVAGVGALVSALVVLMGRTVEQLRRWEADPEATVCELMLPADQDEDEGEDDVDDADKDVEDEAGAAGGGAVTAGGNLASGVGDGDEAGSDEGDALGDAGTGGGGPANRLRDASESLLAYLLGEAPDEIGRQLLGRFPSVPSSPTEPLGAQIAREACYTALGIGAWQLQQSLSFSQLLGAATREADAIGSCGALPLRAQIQARLCWLIPCWWAFGAADAGEEEAEGELAAGGGGCRIGGSGGGGEDSMGCDASYAFLIRLVHAGADAAVKLQAVHVLDTLLRGLSAEDDLRVFECIGRHFHLAARARLGEAGTRTSALLAAKLDFWRRALARAGLMPPTHCSASPHCSPRARPTSRCSPASGQCARLRAGSPRHGHGRTCRPRCLPRCARCGRLRRPSSGASSCARCAA